MAKSRTIRTLSLAVLFSLCIGAMPAAAIDVDFDIAAGIRLSDNVRLFMNISNQHFHPDPDVAIAVVRKVPNPGDDFPVLLFLAAESGRDLGFLWDLRRRGSSWSALLLRIGIPPARLFVGLDRDPGPPYGKAWGHSKHRGRGHAATFSIPDAEFVDLVKIQITSKHFGLSPHDVLRAKKAGKKFEAIAADHHYKRGGKKPAGATGKASSPGKGKDRKQH